MQNAEVRMQNNDFTFGFRLTSKQNHLRFSQVVFLFALPVGGARTSYSAFCILTSAFDKSQFPHRKTRLPFPADGLISFLNLRVEVIYQNE